MANNEKDKKEQRRDKNMQALFKVFEKHDVESLFTDFQLNNEENILYSYGEMFSKIFTNIDRLRAFLTYFKQTKDISKSISVGEINAIIKDFNVSNNEVSKLEVYEVETSNESNEPSSTNGMEDLLEEIRDNTILILQDDADVRLMKQIVTVRNMLDKQINTKTEKKATFTQVEKIAQDVSQIDVINDKLNNLSEMVSKSCEVKKEIDKVEVPKEEKETKTVNKENKYAKVEPILFVGIGCVLALFLLFIGKLLF